MDFTRSPGPTGAEKERFLKKIREWQDQGFDTSELENLLENDFNEFLRRRHDILKRQVNHDPGLTEPDMDIPPDDTMPGPVPPMGSRRSSLPDHAVADTASEMDMAVDPVAMENGMADDDLLLLGEPIPPEDAVDDEAAEEAVIIVGKSAKEKKIKTKPARSTEEPSEEMGRTETQKTSSSEKALKTKDKSAQDLEDAGGSEDSEDVQFVEELPEDVEDDEYDYDDDFEEELEEDDEERKPTRKEPSPVEVRGGSVGGKLGAVAVVIILILAGYYFIWVLPGLNGGAADVSAVFEIQPNVDRFQPGTVITFDASASSGDSLKYQWIFDDDFEVTEGNLKGKIVRGYFTANENMAKDKDVILEIKGKDDMKDSVTKTITVEPMAFEITAEKLEDSGEFKVNGYLDVLNVDGITSFELEEYDADVTINRVHVNFNTKDSLPMTLSLNDANTIEDGFGQTHSVYARNIDQSLVLSGYVSANVFLKSPSEFIPGGDYPIHTDLDGAMVTTDRSYTDLTTYNTIFGKATNEMVITVPVEISGKTYGDQTFESDDIIESYPDLRNDPRSFRLVDLSKDELALGDKSGVTISNTIFIWDAEKIEYVYSRPAVKVNLTIDEDTMLRYNLTEFFMSFWIAEEISQPVKTHLYSVHKQSGTITTLNYVSTMTDFEAGDLEISSSSCATTTPDGHFFKRMPDLNYTSSNNWEYLPPTGQSSEHIDYSTSFDAFTAEDAVGFLKTQGVAEFNEYVSAHPNCYVVSGYCTASGEDGGLDGVAPGTLAWNLTFGEPGPSSKEKVGGLNVIVTEDGSITAEEISIDNPPNGTSDFRPILDFSGSEDILLNNNDKGFFDKIFEQGANSEYWVDLENVEYGVAANVRYPNVDLTSIMFIESSKFAYLVTYDLSSDDGADSGSQSQSQHHVSVALDGESGQLIYYWDHSDNGLNLF